jgi:hypothetical protein
MARGHGRILTSIWEDEDFLALGEPEQRLYLFLISQPNLNHAGLLDLTLRRWARKASGLTVAELENRIAELAKARFIVVDDGTEELLIRSFVRNDGVWRMPKVMGAMVSGALEISSPVLRRALLDEMDRVPLGDLNNEPTKLRNGTAGPSIRRQIADCIETLRKAFGNPTPDPTQGGSATPSVTPSATPSVTPDEGDQEPSTRGHAGAQVHAAPAPAPSPTPAPEQRGAAEADDEPELVLVEDSDFVGAAEAAPVVAEAVTAQTIVGEWIERCTKRPPGQTIGQTSKQIKKLLEEDRIDPDDIRRGLALWMTKGSAPSSIPGFVNEVMNATPRPGSNVLQFSTGQPLPGTDTTVAGWDALAAELRAKENPA